MAPKKKMRPKITLSEKERRDLESWQHSEVISSAMAYRARAIILLADGLNVNKTAEVIGLSRKSVYKWIKRFRLHGVQGLVSLPKTPKSNPKGRKTRQHKVKMSKEPNRKINNRRNRLNITLSDDDRRLLESWQRSETINAATARRGRAILQLAEGKTVCETFRIVGLSRNEIYRWVKSFQLNGVDGLHTAPMRVIKKADRDDIRSAIFSILHAPPSEYNINRTSWRLVDLKMCLAQKGIHVSKGLISQVVKSAGYSWRKAKVVLTSKDPNYSKKLKQIQMVLSKLGDNDCFFSIDEFGPVAINMKGGRRLVAPGEYPTVPQFQKSKGHLIVTAALELKSNQITHFYSEEKNTEEMIKLLKKLIKKYSNAERIYLSWDNASWHVARKLKKRVKEINSPEYRAKHTCPYVELTPLPSGAQFLNVIESVFSGMAKAVIHNSDYQSVEECRSAIDRHISERNQYFLENPKRAGNKIWGKELVKPVFSESHNCKDPKWMNKW
jgi:transposase